MQRPLTSIHPFHHKLYNSRIKVQVIYNNKNLLGESYGFIVSNNKSIYLIIPKHSISDDNINVVKISSEIFNYSAAYKSKSFYTVSNLDAAIIQIRCKYINESQILNTDDFNYSLKNSKIFFSFQFSKYDHTHFNTSNLNYFNHQEVNDFGNYISSPSIILSKCSLENKSKNNIVIKLSGGMSGTLSFTKDNKVHSMFIGTDYNEFVFLPIFYINFLIYQIENSKKNIGINYINLECKINEDNKLECLEDYQGLYKGDVIYKINDLNLNGVSLYCKDLESNILIDQYIMLNPYDEFKFYVKSYNSNKNLSKIIVKSSKVK
jgi:hypothetical protein